MPPPAVAAQSPFLEVLIDEIAASLPAALAGRMKAATSVTEVHDWLAAGAVFRWVDGTADAARAFLDEVSKDPKRAGLALAKSLTVRMEPPARDVRWHRRDRLGLALQLAVVSIVLVGRGLLFMLLGRFGTAARPQLGLEAWYRGVFGLDVLFGNIAEGWLFSAMLVCAALWLAFEAIVVPQVMERVRRLPAVLKGIRPPLAWRIDSFYVCWFLQATIFLVSVCVRAWVSLTQIGASDAASVSQWTVAILIGLVLIAISWSVVTSARAVLKVGTNAIKLSGG